MSHYFSNVTVFDGRTVKTKQGVHVAGGTIEWVGPHARAPRVARAASDVDGTGRTLTPGLIDCHVHLSFDGGADFAGEATGLTQAIAAIKAARNAAPASGARRHDRARSRWRGRGRSAMWGERSTRASSPARGCWRPAGRSPSPVATATTWRSRARSMAPTASVRRSARRSRRGARVIKVMATGGVLTPGIDATFTAFTPEELVAAVDEAHKWGRGVAAHAIGAEGIRNAVVAGVDSVEHCSQVTRTSPTR